MSALKVTVFLAVGLCLFATYLSAEEAKDNAESEDENTIKVYKRLIPADVLRGLCGILLIFDFKHEKKICIFPPLNLLLFLDFQLNVFITFCL